MPVVFMLPKRLKKQAKKLLPCGIKCSLCQQYVIFYIMILGTLSPILIRYLENPEKVKLDIAIEAQIKPLVLDHAILLYLIDGINATIWTAQRSAMSTKAGCDSTLVTPGFMAKRIYF